MSWKRFAAVLAAVGGLALGQETAPLPAFEVASVKVAGPQSKRDSGGGPGTSDPGQYHFSSATLQDLIAIAYHVDYYQISSKTSLDRDRYDVAAKVPAGATRDQFRAMMRMLLAERFHLKTHTESRDFEAWELSIAKSGLKMKESKEDAAPEPMTGPPQAGDDGFPVLTPGKPGYAARFTMVDGFILGKMSAQQEPVSVLTHSFGLSDPPIVDKTGLTGKYDFRLEFSRVPPGAPMEEAKTPPAPDLFVAIERQLGLHFTPKKLPFDVVVVDSVERTPTEN